MPRNRIFGIYVLLGVAALGAGMLVAQFFGTSTSLPSGYTTPAAAAQATAPAAPTAAARPTQAPSSAPTPAAASAPTAALSTEPPSDPSTALPTPTQATSDLPTAPATPTLAPTEPPTAASDPGYIEYTVQRGDILKNIAQQHGVTIGEILAINQIPNPDSLVVASVIRIPRK